MKMLLILVIGALAATGCQASSSTVVAAPSADGDQGSAVTSDGDVDADGDDPDGPDDQQGADEPGADSEPDVDPTVAPRPVRPSQPVDLVWFLGFSPDGAFGFDAVRSPWQGRTACDNASRPLITTIDLQASGDDQLFGFDAGLIAPGEPTQLHLTDENVGVVLTSCGDYPDVEERLVAVELMPDGSLVARSEPLLLNNDDLVQGNWLRGLVDGDTALVEVTVGVDEDYDNWAREVQHIDLLTGAITVTASQPLDDEARVASPPATTPDGRFTYQEIDDPLGSTGCEGYGIAATIAVDDGSGSRPVFGPDQPTYSSITDMHFGPDNLVAWTSGCEGSTTLNLGRINDDGTIADPHWLNLYTDEYQVENSYVEFQHYRLMDDGTVAALGVVYNSETDESTGTYRRIDLSADTGFVNSGPLTPWIDTANPLAPTLAGTGEWFIGESLATNPACGDMTLYASTTGGFVHGLSDGREIDQIVDFVVSDARFVDYGDGFTMNTRAVAVLTECPDEYVGRQLWFGSEPEIPAYGMWLQQADLPALADVISIREVKQADNDSWYDVVAEVVYRDGSVEEVVLQAVPYEG